MTARFNTLLQVRAPAQLINAVDEGADRGLITRSDYVRLAVIERLRADGVLVQTDHLAVAS